MTYDCFSFFNELDLLEMRLNILDEHVDKFVLCESRQTFSGKEKPLYFLENQERFAKWLPKIIHLVAPESTDNNDTSFDRAFKQKEFLKTGLKDAKDDDLVFYGDLDEIWKDPYRASAMYYGHLMVCNLRQLNYCYYLNQRSSEEWVGTVVGSWRLMKDKLFRDLRANHDFVLDDGGWHFTNMGGPDQIRKKLESYDHQEYNHESIKNDIERKIAEGEDYVGRGADWLGVPFHFWVDESELPQYLLDNKEKYASYFK
jgi:hypothetical protein